MSDQVDDVFGMMPRDEELPDFVQDDAPAPEAPALAPEAEAAPVAGERPRDPETGRFMKVEETPLEAPAEEGSIPEAPDEGDAVEEPTAEEEPPRIWAGKYHDPEALEKGYRELRDLQRRTAERAKAYEQRMAEIEFQARQMEDALKRAIPMIRQQQPQGPPQQEPRVMYDQFGNPVPVPQQPPQPQLSPEMVQSFVEQQVNERLALQAQAMQQQQWQAETYAAGQAALDGFFQDHPEVERDGQFDEDMADTVLALNEAWAPIGSTVDITNRETLDIIYEATQRPALRSVLSKFPALIDDDEGMTQARILANQIDGGTQPTPSPAAARMQPRTNTPVVERGSSPAPQTGTPLDEFEQAINAWRGEKSKRGSDVFFGE
jgi:hypothetical protein